MRPHEKERVGQKKTEAKDKPREKGHPQGDCLFTQPWNQGQPQTGEHQSKKTVMPDSEPTQPGEEDQMERSPGIGKTNRPPEDPGQKQKREGIHLCQRGLSLENGRGDE
ncbi:MAG: hypothetical protein UZ16_OP3001002749 [Candidatus Hinthialibacteria bacterium OLB16]|nr:MAG: hypothetical protein UZ16_OP3001002749 [Candidatus Hinthialibacteria bacterium OLB16]